MQIDHAAADRFGNAGTEKKQRHEIEKRGPDDRLLRFQYFCGGDGRDGIGGVMKSIDEIESEGGDNDENQKRKRVAHGFGIVHLGSAPARVQIWLSPRKGKKI